MWCAQNKAHWTQILDWNNTTHIVDPGGRDHTCGWLMQCMVNICASDRPGSDISAAALSCICTQPLALHCIGAIGVLVQWCTGAIGALEQLQPTPRSQLQCNGLANWSMSLTSDHECNWCIALYFKWPVAQLHEEPSKFLASSALVFFAEKTHCEVLLRRQRQRQCHDW